MGMKRLTIFTPTYNRAYILPQLYDSLCEQTCQDFEWLIVDDGSTDHTKELVEGWINENKISIRYVCQENGGKMRAYNKAVTLSETELFVCIDSDDILASKTVVADSLLFWDLHCDENSKKPIAGMISFRISPKGKGFVYVKEGFEVKSSEEIFGMYTGEHTDFVKTDILRHFPYPVFEGEKFTTDAYIFRQMDEKYNFLLHPYYSQICQYHDDGYTKKYRRILFDNPKGYRELHSLLIRLRRPGYWRNIICYISISLFIHDHSLFSKADNLPLTILLYPLGCLKHLYDRIMLFKDR